MYSLVSAAFKNCMVSFKRSKVVPDLKQLSIAVLYLIPQTIDVIQCSLGALEVLRLKITTHGPCWPIGSFGIKGVETRSHSEVRFFLIDQVYWGSSSLEASRFARHVLNDWLRANLKIHSSMVHKRLSKLCLFFIVCNWRKARCREAFPDDKSIPWMAKRHR